MKEFMNEDFLLTTDTARRLYHDYAEDVYKRQTVLYQTKKVNFLSKSRRGADSCCCHVFSRFVQ